MFYYVYCDRPLPNMIFHLAISFTADIPQRHACTGISSCHVYCDTHLHIGLTATLVITLTATLPRPSLHVVTLPLRSTAIPTATPAPRHSYSYCLLRPLHGYAYQYAHLATATSPTAISTAYTPPPRSLLRIPTATPPLIAHGSLRSENSNAAQR
jgi:hypothetical protein